MSSKTYVSSTEFKDFCQEAGRRRFFLLTLLYLHPTPPLEWRRDTTWACASSTTTTSTSTTALPPRRGTHHLCLFSSSSVFPIVKKAFSFGRSDFFPLLTRQFSARTIFRPLIWSEIMCIFFDCIFVLFHHPNQVQN